MGTDDERAHRALLDRVMRRLVGLPLDVTPPQVGQIIHRLIREHITDGDPYRSLKDRYNRLALEMLPEVRGRMLREHDPFLAACQLAIAGSVIDFGASSGEFGLEAIVAEALAADLGGQAYPLFRAAVDKARRILYLGDNTGEIVFDRLLVEELRRRSEAEITFVVRGRPVLNDATEEDAVLAGLDVYARILSNGSDAPATVLDECSPQLREAYGKADLIIAKGQGNYESLSQEEGPLFFLLKAKCPVVARDLDVEVGTMVLRAGAGIRERGAGGEE